MQGTGKSALLVLLLIFLVGLASPVSAQAPQPQYFSETGHTISGSFLAYYQGLKDPLRLLGYPITERFYDRLTGREVQYFQKARLELWKTVSGEEVRQAPLGEFLYEAGAEKAPVSTDSPTCHYFEQTGHSVCYAFWQFYDAYDGAKTLGQPLSEVEIRETRMVQYFQKARLEWRTEMPDGQRVVVTDLGRIYFDKVVGDTALLKRQQPANITASPLGLRARAFVSQVLAPVDSQQTVFVIVQDQFLRAVSEASVSVTAVYPDGARVDIGKTTTNKDGIAEVRFEVNQGEPRQIVQLEAAISAQGQETSATSWFRIWW